MSSVPKKAYKLNLSLSGTLLSPSSEWNSAEDQVWVDEIIYSCCFMKSVFARSSNELQWLDFMIGHLDSSPSTDHLEDMIDCLCLLVAYIF